MLVLSSQGSPPDAACRAIQSPTGPMQLQQAIQPSRLCYATRSNASPPHPGSFLVYCVLRRVLAAESPVDACWGLMGIMCAHRWGAHGHHMNLINMAPPCGQVSSTWCQVPSSWGTHLPSSWGTHLPSTWGTHLPCFAPLAPYVAGSGGSSPMLFWAGHG